MEKIDWFRTTSYILGNKMNCESFCIRFILTMFKFFGLGPASILRRQSSRNIDKKNSSRRLIRLEYSRVSCIYKIFLAALVFGTGLRSVQYVDTYDYPGKTNLSVALEIFGIVWGLTTVIVIWLLLCVKQNSMVKLLNRLMTHDETISHVRVSQKPKSCRRCVIFCFFLNTLSSALNMFVDVKYIEAGIYNLLNDSLPTIIVGLLMMQYFMMVKLIEIRFDHLNRGLLDISTSPLTSRRSSIHDDFSAVNDYYDFSKIIAIRRAHTVLYEISSDVSEYYSLLMLLLITWTCFSIVSEAHFLMLMVTGILNESAPLMAYAIFRLFCLILPITMVATSVSSITNEMRKTPGAIYKVLARPNTSGQVKSKLEQFSFELLKRKVDFTAYGLFSLDCTLLHSMFNMTATYLVIVYQFNTSELTKKG